MGIEECFQSGAVPKRGKVGKVCGILYKSDNSDGGIPVGIEECPFQLVLATVPDHHFGSRAGSEPNRCQIGGLGCQSTRTVNSDTVRYISLNPSELGGLSVGRPEGSSVD
jgi:hypothetical protein